MMFTTLTIILILTFITHHSTNKFLFIFDGRPIIYYHASFPSLKLSKSMGIVTLMFSLILIGDGKI